MTKTLAAWLCLVPASLSAQVLSPQGLPDFGAQLVATGQTLREARTPFQLAAAAVAAGDLRESGMPVNSCWQREPHARADALGLPRFFCVAYAGIEVPRPAKLPFVYGASMIIHGNPVQGRLHISGGARNGDSWTINGSLFSKSVEGRCGELNMAFAALYLDIDLEGEVLRREPQIRGFLADGSPLCRTPAKSIEFLYKRLPQ